MELPQPRPFEAEGRKPIHDFLSACSNSTTIQPDPKPPSQGGNLKTHDFLQPLERVVRVGIGTSNVDIPMASVKSSPASTSTTPSSVQDQHVLPGGIGTYTISHIPYFYHQRLPKPEVSSPMFTVAQTSGNNERNATDENSNSNSNSNCSSFAANGFTLWDESTGKKGQLRKERTNIRVDAATVIGQWQGLERLSQSSTNHHRNSFSSRSSSQGSGLKSQSFMDMIRSAKGSSQDDDLDDDEEDFIMKKENTSTSQSQSQRDLRVKVDGKGSGNDQKPNTPRSKHSATEQRRRSKINDRFQMLRQLIPNSDQKRDKASFLLEVIEYIHFLQEKVNKHEVPYQAWNHQEQGKLMNWRNDQGTGDGNVEFPPKLEDKKNGHQAVATETASFHESAPKNNLVSEAAELNRTTLLVCPVSSDVEEVEEEEEEEEEEVSVHRGTISISSVYSQGLLKTLTETLQTSGVDLSKASISVQIQLSKQPQKNQEVHRTVRARSDDDYIDDNNSSSKQQTKKHKKLKKG